MALLRLCRPLVVLAGFAIASESAGFVDLTGGARLVTRDRPDAAADKVSFRFVHDLALQTIPESPLCPAESAIRFVTDDHTTAVQPLDCAAWSISGPGFRYQDSPDGPKSLRKITLRPGRLIVTLKGAPYGNDPLVGPTSFVETRLTIGSTHYCGRWAEPPGDSKKNDPGRIVTLGPTAACQVDCGNSIVEAPEQCDDGNPTEGDGCDSNCTVTACGNGIVTAGEGCDDGALTNGDGCRSDCTVEICGDGILDVPAEACDDGGTAAGDCCSPSCGFEAGGSSCADDLDVCTDDVCDGAGTCTHPDNAAPCNDSDGCTVDDVCTSGTCGGDLRPPWINEFDYDDFFGGLDDRDEFIEIAGPAGTDLSGFQVIGVEGGPASPCLTPISAPQAAIGEANLAVTIPPGAVLADDTGTGIGFYVVCFTNTSTNVVNIPACDAVLAGPRTYSNLENGYLLNTDETTCPEGILLLDPDDGLVDAVSYEGIVPNVGSYGPFFHVNAPYSAPRDEGWLAGVSIQKVTSTLERAQSASEWVDPSEVPGCVGQGGPTPPPACTGSSASPGEENLAQTLLCGSPCAAFIERSDGLLE